MYIFRLINFRAVFMGFLADLVASTIFGVALTFLMATLLAMKGFRGAELEKGLMTLLSSDSYMLFAIITGLAFTMMGGYVAGRLAKAGEHFHSGVVGILNVIFGLFFIGEFTRWYNIAAFFLVIPVAIIGGDMAKKINRRAQQDPNKPPAS